ncbi:hypothetical protein Tco_1056655 [Tanacetum coccineum]|uniref:Reverse transcriptase Ty1/copia-type domain-containing protein n=1 Tax=Tanacetum coccineum TaxID=301880 RepID=A0ABQ5H5D5_9ASTR
MGELTFFLGLQVTQKDDGIFISQDKYVDEILKKFSFSTVKIASTPMETSKPLMKDENAEDVDVRLYRSMIGSLIYLTSLRPDIIYLKGQPKLGRWYPKDSPFVLEAYTDSDYAGVSLDRKSTTGGCQFLRSRLISWQCKKQTVVANSTTEAKYVAASNKSTENADFDEIVDFLNASTIRYALTVSPTIYVSYIEQFWSTVKIKTVNNKRQIRAKVNGKTIVISESSVRRDLQFNDEDVICLAKNQKFNFSKLIFDGMLRNLDPNSKKFLMYPRFLQLFLNNQIENLTPTFNDEYNTPSHTKKVFANMKRKGKDFSRAITPLFATMMIQPQAVEGEGSRKPSKPQHTPTTTSLSNIEPIPNVPSPSQPQKTQKCRKTKRKATEISQSSGPTNLVADETVHEERGDSVERAATTAASLDAELASGNILRTQSMATLNEPIPHGTGSGICPRRQETILGDRPAQTRFERLSKQSNDPPLSRVNTLKSGEDRMQLNELMEICTRLSERVLALENIKTAQDLEIINLKKRVKKLEKKKKARTPQLKRRLFKVIIESSAEKSLETQERYGHDINVTTTSAPITTDGVFVSTAEPSTPPTTTTIIEDKDRTIAQTLMKMRSEKSKEKAKERGSKEKSSENATRLTRGVTMQEPSKSRTRKAVPPSQHDLKDKGKAKMIKPEKPLKKKDQVKFDEEIAKRLAE